MKVLSIKNLPTRLPIGTTALLWMLLDRLHVPSWVWGSVGAAWVIIVIACIVAMFQEHAVDIFKDKQ